MKVWHCTSSDSRPCVMCNRKTGTYKTYEQANMNIKIPLCDTEERDCYRKVDVKKIANEALRSIKKSIQEVEG
ncbi:hypothetical protein CHH86_03035 [Bacillus paralicheniformis]|nr:hypothetical protein BSZ43_07300 [Bacillus sp. H15-1]ASV14975.1 hypothetical protein CJO35_07355 [Bacillus sp. 1s-1]KAA0815481.1 hypothetical protein EI974_16540 [Bacillus licheniformis]KUL16226.1 hypothetical protein LI6934_16690 [Bacillus licheniformis LMG 6934]PAD00144.1 hypothetical protein CHH86_03035 [Bacillus paralicheniformis]